MNKPIVIIESPYAGNIDRNIEYARAAMKDCFARGEIPFASHLLYTQEGILDDENPAERKLGIEAGFEFQRFADKTAVYDDLGMSKGMHEGISDSIKKGIPIEYRSIPNWTNEIKLKEII